MRETMHKRDLNKVDKRERIIDAARECFRRMGFEQARLSDIAKAAHVAKGTLFSYAESKHDLLVMVFMQELTPIVDRDLRNALDCPLKQRLLEHFRRIVDHSRKFPDLTRLFQKEMAWLSGHEGQLENFSASWRNGIAGLLAQAQSQGELTLLYAPEFLSTLLIDNYLAHQRRWLLGQIDFDIMPEELAMTIDIVLRGASSAGPKQHR